jgi:hypothetical protein
LSENEIAIEKAPTGALIIVGTISIRRFFFFFFHTNALDGKMNQTGKVAA